MSKKKGNYEVVNSNDFIIYDKKSEKAIFKNKYTKPSCVIVHIEGSVYIRVPIKTYRKLEDIKKLYVSTRLLQYQEDWDHDWEEFIHWSEILFTPQDILRYFYKINRYFDAFCMELPKYWNIPSELRYKKIKIKYNNGNKDKISINKFRRKYLKGICF